MPIFGQCRLCLKEGPLQDSHFIPKAAYRLVRGEGKNPHPLLAQANSAIRTSAQMRAHALCRDCEQRLHEGGEDTFFRYCYRDSEGFRLLEMLRRAPALLQSPKAAVYVVPSADEKTIEQIGYFGVSLFWKSSVQAWNDGTGPAASIPLGPYEERFRRFLMQEGNFPAEAAIVIEVSDESNRLIRVVGTPFTMKKATNHVHCVHICGVRFNLMVGQRMPQALKQLCAFRRSPKIVLVSKNEESDMATLYRDLLTTLAQTSDPQGHPR